GQLRASFASWPYPHRVCGPGRESRAPQWGAQASGGRRWRIATSRPRFPAFNWSRLSILRPCDAFVQSLSEIRALLASRGLAPRHALGQNFLIDHNLLRKLVEASGVGPGDVVLEVGPGTGTLTEALLEAGCTVIACELDRGLAQLLRE